MVAVLEGVALSSRVGGCVGASVVGMGVTDGNTTGDYTTAISAVGGRVASGLGVRLGRGLVEPSR